MLSETIATIKDFARRLKKRLKASRPRDLVLSHKDRNHHSADEFIHIPLLIRPPLDIKNDEKAVQEEAIERLSYPERPGLVQLFFDLFFVANLTTFNSIHEVNDGDTLKSYIGFFSILWFTWFQVAVFDLRFGFDSIVERACKGLHFGILTGIAIISPGYNISFLDEDDIEASIRAFKSLSIILMVSRLILCLQYGAVLWHLRRSSFRWPLAAHILVLFSAAMIFLGLFFAFNESSGAQPLTGFYIVVGIEASIVLLLSLTPRALSFRKTCIVERMGLLTLIILGEGVIGLCGAVQKLGSDREFSSDIIGAIICGIVIIYCAWIFYFDQTVGKKIGSIRQLFWIILHFPYHVAVLLVLEGVSQLAVWRKVLDYWSGLDYAFNDAIDIPDANNSGNMTLFVSECQELAEQFFHRFEAAHGNLKISPPWHDINTTLDKMLTFPDNATLLSSGSNNSTAFYNAFSDAFSDLFAELAVFAAESLGIEAPEAKAKEAVTVGDTLDALYSGTFVVVFVYFYFCAGALLILNVCLYFFGNRRKLRGDILDAILKMIIGVGMILVGLLQLSPNPEVSNALSNFQTGKMVLPVVCIAYFLLVVINNLLVVSMRWILDKNNEGKRSTEMSRIPHTPHTPRVDARVSMDRSY